MNQQLKNNINAFISNLEKHELMNVDQDVHEMTLTKRGVREHLPVIEEGKEPGVDTNNSASTSNNQPVGV